MLTFSDPSAELFDKPVDGVVEAAITGRNPGRVRALGTSWPGKLCVPDPNMMIPPGTEVYVVGLSGNTLWILPSW
jgi:membrane protein implicated in regulation of membrane protease activity